MLLTVNMPRMIEGMDAGVVQRVLVEPGARVERGTKLLEVMVDLSAAAPQDCPPIFFFRLVAREAGWMRTVPAEKQTVAVGDVLAVVSTEPDEPLEGVAPTRELKSSRVGCPPGALWSTG